LIITDIQQQKKNQDRYSIFIDGAYSFSLPTDDVLDAKLHKGQELTASDVKKFEKKSQDSLLIARAVEKALRRPHSRHEMSTYLKLRGAEADLIEYCLAKLEARALVNDAAFVEYWASMRRRRNKSDSYIRAELLSKGVDKDVLESFFSDNQEDPKARILRLIEKKRNQYEQQKLIAYLQRQGFRYSDIQDALNSLKD
jgi:regulatory protein